MINKIIPPSQQSVLTRIKLCKSRCAKLDGYGAACGGDQAGDRFPGCSKCHPQPSDALIDYAMSHVLCAPLFQDVMAVVEEAEYTLHMVICRRHGGRAASKRLPWLMLGIALLAALAVHAVEPRPDARAFMREVDKRLEVPPEAQTEYARRLETALALAGVDVPGPQYLMLVDRAAHVQAGFVYWRSPEGAWQLIGASPVATGRPGEYEHFLTPLGVFAHSLANLDFRAEGTRNVLGIRGYGVKGMRIYDFGWVEGERTWAPGQGLMRLQMHATDPDLLEPLLGEWHSKGCIRIPATLNVFIDRYGLLDADYEAAARAGDRLWMLP